MMDGGLAKLEGCGYLAVVFTKSDCGYFEMWKKLRCTFLSAGWNCAYGFAADSACGISFCTLMSSTNVQRKRD